MMQAEDIAAAREARRKRAEVEKRCLASPTTPIEPGLCCGMLIGLILKGLRSDLAQLAWGSVEAFHAKCIASAVASGESNRRVWERASRGGREPKWDSINGNDIVLRKAKLSDDRCGVVWRGAWCGLVWCCVVSWCVPLFVRCVVWYCVV